jgi:hypothetical protein
MQRPHGQYPVLPTPTLAIALRCHERGSKIRRARLFLLCRRFTLIRFGISRTMLFLRLLGGPSLCGGPAGGRSASPGAWAVERVVDMGNHLHAVGAVGGVRVDLRLRSGDPMPSPGDRVRIAARANVPLG